jgi:hypothetical protein
MSDYSIHSEARAGHWVAWAVAAGESKPAGAVILPGQTREEAEANAQHWVERIGADSLLPWPDLQPASAEEPPSDPAGS